MPPVRTCHTKRSSCTDPRTRPAHPENTFITVPTVSDFWIML